MDLLKKMFIRILTFVGSTFVDINSNESFYYLFSVSVSKCGGNCNAIDNPYGRICVQIK